MKIITSIVIVSMLSACATSGANYRPVVDMKGHDAGKYQDDLLQCQQYATQRADAATGVVAGAVVGALLIAALGGRGQQNQQGAIFGGVTGAAAANETQETIIKKCLVGRGYSVLS